MQQRSAIWTGKTSLVLPKLALSSTLLVGTTVLCICMTTPVAAQDRLSPAQEIEQQLRQLEVTVPLDSDTKPSEAEDIAHLSLDLDQARGAYATALQLSAEGITPGRVVAAAQATYEHLQVQIAAKRSKVSQALSAINSQRKVAESLALNYRRQLAASGMLPM